MDNYDKEFFRNMRSGLSPDRELTDRVLKKAAASQPGKERPHMEMKNKHEETNMTNNKGGFVKSRFGITAAAVLAVAAAGTAAVIILKSDKPTKDDTEPAAPVITESQSSIPEKPAESSFGSTVETQQFANLVLTGKGETSRGLVPYMGSYDNGAEYAEVLGKYKQAFGKDVKVYNLCCPTSAAYYMPENISAVNEDQHKAITDIGEKLNGITNIDVYDMLASHKDEDIYFRSAEYWSPLGAYYAMKVFTDNADPFNFPAFDSYTEYSPGGFVGELNGYTQQTAGIDPDFGGQFADKLVFYKPRNDDKLTVNYWNEDFTKITEERGHSLYLPTITGREDLEGHYGVKSEICEVKTELANGRVLLMIKDRSGGFAVPFLTGSFEKIYTVDLDNTDIKLTELAKQVGATDVLFLMTVPNAGTKAKVDALLLR